MILAIDIGNTNIVIGCVDEKKTYFIERLATVKTKTELEYAIDIKVVLELYGISREDIKGGIICSVVPQITSIVRLAAEKVLRRQILVVGPGIKTGLNILMDNPAQLGSDLGTATTICVIDEKKNYIGGMILPGVMVSLNSLTAHAAQLQGISLEPPRQMIGKNTIDCMKSGIINGNASVVDGMIDRIEEEIGKKATAVATGGLAKAIVPYCRRKVILDDNLLLKGLLIIYNKNKG